MRLQVVYDYRTNLSRLLLSSSTAFATLKPSSRGATEGIEGPPAMQHALAQLKAHRVPMQEGGPHLEMSAREERLLHQISPCNRNKPVGRSFSFFLELTPAHDARMLSTGSRHWEARNMIRAYQNMFSLALYEVPKVMRFPNRIS